MTLKIRFDKISFVENAEDKILELNELIKELDKKLIVTKKEIKDGIMYIYCDTKKQKSKCKYCGQESEKVHSTYKRTISDLPIQNYKVKLIINVKKYFCNNTKLMIIRKKSK